MARSKLDWETYRNVGKMNKTEMETYLTRLYRLAFVDGTESSNDADFKIKLVQVLNRTKGVGEKTIENVLATLKEME